MPDQTDAWVVVAVTPWSRDAVGNTGVAYKNTLRSLTVNINFKKEIVMQGEKVLWISNHPCSPEQKADMEKRWGDIDLTELNNPMWGKISPHASCDDVGDYIQSFVPYVADFGKVVVMGELTACLLIVSWCVLCGVPCYTPTTERVSKEKTVDGKTVKTSVFRHVQFRRLFVPDPEPEPADWEL